MRCPCHTKQLRPEQFRPLPTVPQSIPHNQDFQSSYVINTREREHTEIRDDISAAFHDFSRSIRTPLSMNQASASVSASKWGLRALFRGGGQRHRYIRMQPVRVRRARFCAKPRSSGRTWLRFGQRRVIVRSRLWMCHR